MTEHDFRTPKEVLEASAEDFVRKYLSIYGNTVNDTDLSTVAISDLVKLLVEQSLKIFNKAKLTRLSDKELVHIFIGQIYATSTNWEEAFDYLPEALAEFTELVEKEGDKSA